MDLWRRKDQDLDEEIQSHIAMAIRDRIERGEDPKEAELAASREFGNQTLTRESMRDIWRWPMLEELTQDIRHALRGMRKQPGLTAVIVASLALGIGANTAIFSLVYSVMLRALPVAHPEQLVELLQKYPGEPRGNGYWTPRSYQHYRDNNLVFSALAGPASERHEHDRDFVEPAGYCGTGALAESTSNSGNVIQRQSAAGLSWNHAYSI